MIEYVFISGNVEGLWEIDYEKNFALDVTELNIVKNNVLEYPGTIEDYFKGKGFKEDVKITINLDNGHFFVESISKKDILLALVHRYSFIHYTYELNQIGDAILIEIVSNELTYQLLDKENSDIDVFNEIRRNVYLSSILNPIIKDIHHLYTKDFYISSWKTGKQQLRDLLSNLLAIAKLSDISANRAITFAEYDDSDELKNLDNKTMDEEFLEDVGEVLREFRPHGYHDLPNSEEYRKKDKEELISIYKKFI